MSVSNIIESKKKIEIILTCTLFKDGAYWVAYNPELNVSSFGITQKKAKSALKEAMDLFIDEIKERGKTTEALNALGWTISSGELSQSSVPKPSLESIKKFSNSFKLYDQATFISLV